MKTNVLKTELQQIRELIRAKRYDEARAGLSVLDHPIAQRWLAKLDEIAPPSTKSALPWRKICILAIRHPSIRTFEIIAADPGASAIRASSWVFFSTFGGLAASILLLALLSIVVLILLGSAPSGGASLLYDGFILCLIISLGALAQFWVGIGAMQIAAKILGGKGSASKLAFAVASFTSLSLFLPIAFLAMVFPIIQTLIAATNLYGIMLTILVVAAVNRFGWVKSFLVGLIPIAVSLALVAGINMATVRFINQGPAMYPRSAYRGKPLRHGILVYTSMAQNWPNHILPSLVFQSAVETGHGCSVLTSILFWGTTATTAATRGRLAR
jgi:hypothetical protein